MTPIAAPRPAAWWHVFPLAAWTLFVWGGRVRNFLADDQAPRAVQVAPAAAFLAAGVVLVLVAVIAPRFRNRRDALLQLVIGIGLVSVAWWTVRMATIVVGAVRGEHSVAFVVIHAVLAIGFVFTTGLAFIGSRRT